MKEMSWETISFVLAVLILVGVGTFILIDWQLEADNAFYKSEAIADFCGNQTTHAAAKKAMLALRKPGEDWDDVLDAYQTIACRRNPTLPPLHDLP